MPATRYLNLVFQGGGVRGIAYAGALAKKPEHCKINAVAGTSAGAIVAALLAVGTQHDKLKAILESEELFSLLQEAEVKRRERLKEAWTDASGFFAGNVSWWKLWKFKRRHPDLADDLRSVWTKRGLHTSDRLRQWLDHVLQGKKFEHIHKDIKDLKIVAADVTDRGYVIYSKSGHLNRPIAEAVHASVSIPLFFSPLTNGPQVLVDGGLLSNFPSFLFAQGTYPTIGFRLLDIGVAGPITSTAAYLHSLLLTMVEAHDKQRGDPPHFRAYEIPTPADIPSWKFDLTPDEVKRLYDCGVDSGNQVDWDRYSSPEPVVFFYEPNPQEALQYSLSQAHQLWEKFSDRELWVEKLESKVVFTVHIEQDWSTRYETLNEMQVSGEKPLFLLRSRATAAGPSIVGNAPTYEEVTPQGRQDLVRIPAVNREDVKGFIVFFVPPVSKDQEPRQFHTELRIPEEFEKTVKRGHPDTVTFRVQQLAQDQRLRLKMRILVDVDLPELDFHSEFGSDVTFGGEGHDRTGRRKYQAYECDAGERTIDGMAYFVITLRLANKR